MTDPIGTAQERELIDFLRNDGRARNRHQGPNAPLHKSEQAADALESRIAEVGRLTTMVEGCEAALVEAKAQLEYLDRRHRKDSTVSTLECIDRALSLQRRV